MAKPKGSTSEELVVERLEIVATEQPGGTESGEGSTGTGAPGTGAPGTGEGGGENAPWHQEPDE